MIAGNPAVFNTSLAHQYYLLGEILIGQGEPEGEVVEWLDWLRRNGEDYSFVRQLPDRDDPAMRKVLDRLEKQQRLASLPTYSDEEKIRRFWRRIRVDEHSEKSGEDTTDPFLEERVERLVQEKFDRLVKRREDQL